MDTVRRPPRHERNRLRVDQIQRCAGRPAHGRASQASVRTLCQQAAQQDAVPPGSAGEGCRSGRCSRCSGSDQTSRIHHEIVVEILQTGPKLATYPGAPPFRSGATLIMGEGGQVRYVIFKLFNARRRRERQRAFLAELAGRNPAAALYWTQSAAPRLRRFIGACDRVSPLHSHPYVPGGIRRLPAPHVPRSTGTCSSTVAHTAWTGRGRRPFARSSRTS